MSDTIDNDGLARWSARQVDACPKREGTAASHCDHQTSPQVHPMMAHNQEFTCCHCGRHRIEKHVPNSGGGYTNPQHGPFAPKVTVLY